MPAWASESIVLRTYPLRESDVIVSFFTRDLGKLRGTARAVRKQKNSFGSGLERMSLVKMYYSQRETRELVTCTTCELIRSPFDLLSHYEASVALDFLAEVSELLLPPEEPSETYFRLLLSVLDYLHQSGGANIWPAVTYFAFWSVRLSGFLAEVSLRPESRQIADEMLVTPVRQFAEREWTKQTAVDLRRQMVRLIEEHVEKKLLSAPLLEAA